MVKPGAEELIDSFGRVHRDLRISITDRCDLRCTYCMPAEGLAWTPRAELLTPVEFERIARVAVEMFGIGSIRVTGGEPLVRSDVVEIVGRLSRLGVDTALTTNGTGLVRLAEPLADAGLARINISCDTLRHDRFVELTRRDRLGQVLDGIEAANAAGFDPVKINVVLMGGVNDDEIGDWARFGREQGVEVRFIEFMPLEAGGTWDPDVVVGHDVVLAEIEKVAPVRALASGSAPAERYEYLDGAGSVGIIASVTKSFCHTCDRIRLTSTGQFRNCLFAHGGLDLAGILRSGGTDDEIAELMRRSVADKWAGHGVGTPTFIRPKLTMSQIGG